MWYRIISICMLLGFTFLVAPVFAQDETPLTDSAFEPVECWFAVPFLQRIDCGYVTVPENHADLDGNTIRVAVAIVRSPSRNPHPDPIIVLVGGPGGAGTDLVEVVDEFFEPMLASRDIILLDQRGTGYSEPNLTCPDFVMAYIEIFVNGAFLSADDTMPDAINQCGERFAEQGVAVEYYTTAQNAADIDAVGTALGYDSWNLYGISYGTYLAQAVMRDYPSRIRSVILDSVVPADINMYGDAIGNSARGFQTLFVWCANDTLCNLFYPDLETVFYEVVETLNTQPLIMPITHPDSGVSVTFEVNGYVLTSIVFNALYRQTTIGMMPGLIYNLHNGEPDGLDDFLLNPLSGAGEGLSVGLMFSVICSDFVPTSTLVDNSNFPDVFRRATTPFSEGHVTICQNWATDATRAQIGQPVESDIPTLLVAGEFDPVTPPSYALHTGETLSNSYTYIFPGIGHGVVPSNSCGLAIATRFIDDPSTAPAADCIDNLRPPTLIFTQSVSRPGVQAFLFLMGAVAMIGLTRVGVAVAVRRRYRLAWLASLRMSGWLPYAITIAVLVVLVLMDNSGSQISNMPMLRLIRSVETVLPVAVGVMAAFAFSPEDEAPLEVMLAAPRRIRWVLLERLTLTLLPFSVVGIVATGIVMSITEQNDVVVNVMRWVAPSLLFSGIAVFLTLATRRAVFGVAMIILMWFGFLFVGDSLLPGHLLPWPLNYVQPIFWPIHAYLQPDSFANMGDYWLNRFMLVFVGINLIAYAVYQLRDEEKLLQSKAAKVT